MIKTITAYDRDKLIEAVQESRQSGWPLVDYGLAHSGMGNRPPERHIQLELRGGILEHHREDMTVRVDAGATIGQVRDALAPANQFLPLDADDDLTIGEVINHNVYGPMKHTYGASRDLLLGLSYVDGLGREITVGGRTVKNVAGYDLTRFMVGGMGEFGCIHSVTMRTYAVPPHALTVRLRVESLEEVDALLPRWLCGDAAPALLEMEHDDGFHLRCGYLGSPSACRAQYQSLQQLLSGTTTIQIVTPPVEQDVEQVMKARTERTSWQRGVSSLVKLIVPPAATCNTCAALLESAFSTPLRIDALPDLGRIFIGADLSASEAVLLDRHVGEMLTRVGGMRVWHRRPDGAEAIAPFGPTQPDIAALLAIKRAVDPGNLFNPERYLPRAVAQ